MKMSFALLAFPLLTAASWIGATPARADLPSGNFHLKTLFRGQCLGWVSGGQNAGAAKLEDCANYAGQVWKATPVPGAWYSLSNGSGKCLDIVNGGALNNYVVLNNCGGFSGQHWHVTDKGGGWFSLTTSFRGSAMCLDIANGGKYDGQAHLVDCKNVTGQSWQVTP